MTPLDALAERAGIEPSFQDAHGKTREATPEVKRKLLAAMGFAAEDDAQAAESLAGLEAAEWNRVLPPVCVTTVGAVAVEAVLAPGSTQVAWRVTLEAGGEFAGEAAVSAPVATTTQAGRAMERHRLALAGDIPAGYHRLYVGDGEMLLIVAPERCWLPPGIVDGGRIWGVTTQLYLMRSAGNWGIGDFSDLHRLVGLLAPRGADVIGLNPLHAMFLDNPEQASPYSPASRLLLNVLNIDVTAVAEFDGCEPAQDYVNSAEFVARVGACRSAALVDYAGVAELKLRVLAMLFISCKPGGPEQAAFETFRRERGLVLERTCVFQALREHLAKTDPSLANWQNWPAEFHDPDGPAVAQFAQAHADRVTFRAWLQFLADSQLGRAAEAARTAGMAVGLYRDLAVGADRSGAETWANPRAVVSGAQVGAPPDIYNPAGQDWGLPPFHPRALREEGYRSFIELVRANMRHAGGLRIDHVMALQHLYWVPKGSSPADGAYVRYDLAALVGILALESQRQHCIVVGEDLGTVPAGFRDRMAEANILSYRVLFFEQDAQGGFLPPAEYPRLSLSVAGSHDLPTLRGWWGATDIELKQRLGLYPAEGEVDRQRAQRVRDHAALLAALRREQLLPPEGEVGVDALVHAAHAFLARTPAMLAMAQLDDITDEADPVNVPSTSDEHPNWRRRISVDLEALADHSRLDEICDVFNETRANHRVKTATDKT